MPTHSLWTQISPVLANDILLHTQKSNKKLYRTTVEIMAPHFGVRPPKVLELPKVERHATFVELLGKPQLEALSFNILSTWLVDNHTAMLNMWLDSLGIAHDERGCANAFPVVPEKAALKKAVDGLLAKFDPTLVTVYLNAFYEIDEVHWPALKEILEQDARLKIGEEKKAA